jgi:hypothetical protein
MTTGQAVNLSRPQRRPTVTAEPMTNAECLGFAGSYSKPAQSTRGNRIIFMYFLGCITGFGLRASLSQYEMHNLRKARAARQAQLGFAEGELRHDGKERIIKLLAHCSRRCFRRDRIRPLQGTIVPGRVLLAQVTKHHQVLTNGFRSPPS